MSFVGISYGLTALAFIALGLLVLTSWRGTPLGRRLLITCVALVVWAIAIIINNAPHRYGFLLIYISELAKNLSLLAVIFAIAGKCIPRLFKATTWGFGFLLLLLSFGRESINALGLINIAADQLLTRTGLLFSFLGLVSLEQTYRNAGVQVRHSLHFLIFGFGCIFVYDLFLYSQVELFHGISEEAWVARGLVNALVAPMLAVAIRRNPDWAIEIFVSRQIVFYTTAFLAVGVYLLFVAVGGYYVRIVGGTWGGVAQIFFFSGSFIVLISILFSQAVRRRTKVFIAKHFYKNKYDYRLEWLRFVQTLSTRDNVDIRRTAIYAVAQTIGSPSGILFTADESGQHFIPTAMWPTKPELMKGVTETHAKDEFIRILAERQWIIDLQEYRHAPEIYQNLALPAWLENHPTFRIVSPVLELDRLAGFIVLEEATPAFDLTYEDRDLLKTIGRHIATYLAQHEASSKLAEGRQFEAYNRLTAFMMHDLKNSVAQLQLIVANAARHKQNPDFIDDTIETIANTADRMTRLIDQLRGDAQRSLSRRIELNELAAVTVKRCADRSPIPTLVRSSGPAEVLADGDRLQAVLEHVVRNAQDATPSDGRVTITVTSLFDAIKLHVSDTGTGMDAQFIRERLFKPFDSTKGSKGMGIGAHQVREYVRSLGGDVEVRSNSGEGTIFTLSFAVFAAATTLDVSDTED